ncbi:MAG TPA: NUDIX domain-containing protein [Candidatus Dormibacteraeota bacterium]
MPRAPAVAWLAARLDQPIPPLRTFSRSAPEPQWDDGAAVAAPPAAIRPIVLAVIRSEDQILVFRGEDPVKAEVFYRPLGGGIEFGETGETAIRREIREEIGAELVNIRPLGALENIFTYDGGPGHEIVLLFDADLLDTEIYHVEQIAGLEADGGALTVTWKPLVDFRGGDRLYPEGLLSLLDANR